MTPQKTERQRAEEALGVADRKVKRTEAKLADARKLVKDLEGELAPLKRRRDFLANDPALPQEPTADESAPADEREPDEVTGDDDLDDLPLDERIRNGA